MSEVLKRALTAGACVLMGCAVAVVMTYRAKTPTQENLNLNGQLAGQQKYAEILSLVDQYYIGDDVDITEINDGMAAGIIAGLGDRWSYYVSAEDYESYRENINNEYVGVGITIQAKLDDNENLIGYEVNDVTQGGPAEEAGILAGFVLIRVGDTDVKDISLTEVKNMVKGEEGTTVNLTFLVDGNQEATFTVERRALSVIPARGQLLKGGQGYIIIDNFDAGCAETVKQLVKSLSDQGATSLIFDVRNNPGGLKKELTNLLDYLLPEGIVFHTVDYAGNEDIIKSDASCVELPMAVLVNASSYSAAEYFACALQEYGVAKVIGQHTFGKGYYQVGLNLSDGSAVNLSIGKYYTPNGVSLIDVGVTPDIELELDEDQAMQLARKKLKPEEDPQLQAAIESLQP